MLNLSGYFFKVGYCQNASPEFFPNGIYDQKIPSVQNILGLEVGDRPLRYQEILRYFIELDQASERARLVEFGETYEGRKLHYLIISSEKNMENLEQIRIDISKLSDPRKLSAKTETEKIFNQTPAVAWMMYGIHGDELSGPDAAVQLAYQLTAGEDSSTQRLRRELVICIHPMENPDGRERFLAQMEQWKSLVGSHDNQSIQHTGVWPWGRGNHYHFDLNRDWFPLVNKESLARVREIMDWHPQLMVDAHEMGSLDTYLFSPSREPINPQIPLNLQQWSHKFAQDQAQAMDKYGWSYYTREWLEDWYPGYGSSWPFLTGAVGILYEQAGVEGSRIRRREGTIMNYRETVHHQFISSLANLNTAAVNRQQLLKEFYSARKQAISAKGKMDPKVYYILPEDNHTLTSKFIDKLRWQGIEVKKATEKLTVTDLHSYWQKSILSKTLPEGTFLVRLNQPLSPLIQAILEFDPRMSSEFLAEERQSLLKEKETKIYDVTAWSFPLAYGLEVYWSSSEPPMKTEKVDLLITPKVLPPIAAAAFGYVFEYSNNDGIQTLTKLLEQDYKIRAAKKTFKIQGKHFEKGSLLLRINENPASLTSDLQKIVDTTGSAIYPVQTALAEEGSDLGGNDFVLLEKPRIAVINGPGISTTSFSALWYLLDQEMQIRHSILLSDQINNFDLSKYNLLILPSSWQGIDFYQRMFGKTGMEKLKSWVQGGGTLIGLENGAAFLADSSSKLVQTRLLNQSFKNLDFYQKYFNNERKLGQIKIDSLDIWEGQGVSRDSVKIEVPAKEQISWLQKQDELNQLFSPIGAILRIILDEDHWLNYGMDKEIPAIIYGPNVFLAMDPVQVPAKFSAAANLRLSGLLWPEARSRWANSAYVTVEKIGKGQVILFAGDPFFRAYFHGSGRLLINCLLLAPGMGTYQSVPW
jgi:hypothetical protein